MSAQEIIIEIIKSKVAIMNTMISEATVETMERFRNELNGMMVCLKNISTKKEFHIILLINGRYEFGYYDDTGKWFSIVK